MLLKADRLVVFEPRFEFELELELELSPTLSGSTTDIETCYNVMARAQKDQALDMVRKESDRRCEVWALLVQLQGQAEGRACTFFSLCTGA